MKSIMFKGKASVRSVLGALALGGYMAVGSLSVQAATSFPNYPLQTGAGAVSPNIMFILDDSWSMAYRTMPYEMNSDSRRDLLDTPFERSVDNNTIFYSPLKLYTPWLNWDGTSMTGGADPNAVYTDQLSAGPSIGSIVDSVQSVFYVLKSGATDSTDATQYERYRITNAVSPVVVKDSAFPSRAQIDTSADTGWSQSITTNESKLAVFTSGGTGNLGIQVSDAAGKITTVTSDVNRSATEHDNTEAVVMDLPANGGGIGNNFTVTLTGTFTGAHVQVMSWTPNETAAVPTGSKSADAAAEARNFATWYSYYSTRMKVAKGGASKAFSGLGSGYRIGFDRINTTAGNVLMPIPTDASEFSGTNKTAWFSYLFQTGTSGSTPLRSALKRTGEFYKTAAAWTDSGASTSATCRTAYALLSTDGYWNGDGGFVAGDGTDQDQDGYANTLADVAAYYYKNDLMPSLANNVPTTTFDKANWQHMVTFGVALGVSQTAASATPPNWTQSPDPTQADGTPGIDLVRMNDLWHAAINASGRYIGALDSDQYAEALKSALIQIDNSKASGSNITANGNSLNDGSQLFQAMYNTPIWTGDILAYDITMAGIAGKSQYDWSLGQQAGSDASFRTRPVLIMTATGAQQFSATTAPAAYVTKTTAMTATTGVTLATNVAYLLGDASQEKRNGGKLRNRTEILPDPTTGNNVVVGDPIGDIVNSSPYYVRQLNALFIGANDGMLHGIDSVSGKVLFSYMPAGIDYGTLATLSDPNYVHHFFVDGQVDVSNQDQGGGSNILVSSLGRGGRGIFALDVTSTNTHDVATGAFTGTFTASNVLFDNTLSTDNDMGYVLSQPQVRMSNAGYPIIITGNGVDSTNGHAVLYIYNKNGTLLRKLDTGIGGGNGLMQTSVADTNGDGVIDAIYAGDLKGNVWQFNISGTSPSSWDFTLKSSGGAGLPLFTAKDAAGNAQPITGGITATKDTDSGNIFLVFGTGRLIGTSDLVSSSVQPTQTIYGLSEAPGSSPTAISSRAALTQHQFRYFGTDSAGRTARSLDAYSALPASSRGWYVDLGADNSSDRGERVVTSPVVNGTAAWISSLIPLLGSGCTNTGRGYLNAIDVFTGTNPPTGSFFYFSGSGTDTGKVSVGGNTPSGANGYTSSIDLGVAMPGAPAIVDSKVVVNGSNANMASADITSGMPSTYRMMWRELVNQN